MYKALITDLDGSAVDVSSNGSDVDNATRLSVQRAQELGFHIAAATGRDWELAKPVVRALGITSLCIVSGGSAIVNPVTEELIWEQPLTPGTTEDIFAIFRAHASVGDLDTSDDPTGTTLTKITKVPHTLRYMYLIGALAEEAETISMHINMGTFAVAHMTPSWSGADFIDVHVTHPKATKEHALRAWHELEGITDAETIAMGDSGNDVPLFKAAGLKIATGNATQQLKDFADYVAPKATDHALKHVIDTFLLS